MRRWACGFTVLIGLWSLEACGPSSFYYNCHTAEDINATTRSEVTTESVKFARAAFDGNTPQAFDQLTDEAKKNISQDQLTNIFQGIKESGPYENLRLERLMTVSTRGGMQQQTGVADCAKNTALTEDNVRVVIANVPEQAYAFVSAKGSHENWFATLWLIPYSGKWQIQSFQVTMGTAAGKPVDEILAMARQENGQGHTLNAGALYAAAATLAAHGSFYHTGLEDIIQKEAQHVSPPQEFRQRPPFTLQGAVGSFSIVRLSPLSLKGKLYLAISQEVSPWQDSREIEQKNRSLIKTFASRFPEYQNVFAGLVAEATESGSTNGWRTVMENSVINGH